MSFLVQWVEAKATVAGMASSPNDHGLADANERQMRK